MNTLFDKGTAIQGAVEEAAIAYHKAKIAYNKAWTPYWESVLPLNADRFWELMEAFRREVFEGHHKFESEPAIREFFRQAVTHEGAWSFEEAIRFSKFYEELVGNLYRPLFDVVEDKSDDSYGDLLDSLPLVGREECEKFLEGYYGNNLGFRNAVFRSLGVDPNSQLRLRQIKRVEYVMNGENYHRMYLRDSSKYWYGIEEYNKWVDTQPEEQ